MTIDSFPDLVLLEIFDFYVGQPPEASVESVEEWIALVHVCRKWRDTVFGSPRRLNLHLLCRDTKHLWGLLDIWPPLPIVVSGFDFRTLEVDTVVAALEHNDRVHQIKLYDSESSGSRLQRALPAMQKPFPALTVLTLEFTERLPNVPNSFLGISAPALRSLSLKGTPFSSPGLRKLLLSSTNLVKVRLWRIPQSTYISPEEIATCLSTLTRLEEFRLGFESYTSRLDQDSHYPHPPPPQPTRHTLYTLPALTSLEFYGPNFYMEDLISRVRAPILESLTIVFFLEFRFDTLQLAQFIGRTPIFKTLSNAGIYFNVIPGVVVSFQSSFGGGFWLAVMRSASSCRQLETLALLCATSFHRALAPTAERLCIRGRIMQKPHLPGNIIIRQWLEILHPFTTLKRLYLSEEVVLRVTPTLQERATELLPALQSLYLERLVPLGEVEEAIKQFVAARQPSSNSIVICPG